MKYYQSKDDERIDDLQRAIDGLSVLVNRPNSPFFRSVFLIKQILSYSRELNLRRRGKYV